MKFLKHFKTFYFLGQRTGGRSRTFSNSNSEFFNSGFRSRGGSSRFGNNNDDSSFQTTTQRSSERGKGFFSSLWSKWLTKNDDSSSRTRNRESDSDRNSRSSSSNEDRSPSSANCIHTIDAFTPGIYTIKKKTLKIISRL